MTTIFLGRFGFVLFLRLCVVTLENGNDDNGLIDVEEVGSLCAFFQQHTRYSSIEVEVEHKETEQY